MKKPNPTPAVANEVPWSYGVTERDNRHDETYIRVLEADEEGLGKDQMAGVILSIDTDTEPDWARRAVESYLACARWMTEVGYRHPAAGRNRGASRRRPDMLQFLTLLTLSLNRRAGHLALPQDRYPSVHLCAPPARRSSLHLPRARSVPPRLARLRATRISAHRSRARTPPRTTPDANRGARAHFGQPAIQARIDTTIHAGPTITEASRRTITATATHTSHRHSSVPACFPAQEKFTLVPLFAYSPQSRSENADAWLIIQLNVFSTWRRMGKRWEQL